MADHSHDKAVDVATKISGPNHQQLRAPFSRSLGELARQHQQGLVVFGIESKQEWAGNYGVNRRSG